MKRHCPEHEPVVTETDFGNYVQVSCRCGAIGPAVRTRGSKSQDEIRREVVRLWERAIDNQGDTRVQR